MIHLSGHRYDIVPDAGYKDRENYFCVNCCGYEKYLSRNHETLRKNGRLDYQMIYLINGSAYFSTGDDMMHIPYGNIILFAPEEVQKYAYYFRDTPELCWIHFTGYGAHDLLEKVGLSNGFIHYVGLHNECIEYFKKIMLELQLKNTLYEQIADTTAMSLLAYLGKKKKELTNPNSQSMDVNIQKIIQQMHSKYHKQWKIEDLAKQCNLSPNRFMHNFKSQTGMPAMTYLIKIRIDKAKDLLLNSSLSIKEISDIVGYDNPLYFSRLFRKIAGVSPRSFRKSYYIFRP